MRRVTGKVTSVEGEGRHVVGDEVAVGHPPAATSLEV